MMAHKIITITGELGSGKSTVSKLLATMLGARRYSTGDVQRQMAQARGISTLELNILAEQDPSIDQEIDSIFADLKTSQEDLVIDSRMAWHFIPESVKIKLTVSKAEAAQRVHQDDSRVSETSETIAETHSRLAERQESERRHFMKNYGVDVNNDNNFDFVIDTSSTDPKEVAILISNLVQEKNNTKNKYWISPKNIFPTKLIQIPADQNITCQKKMDDRSPMATIKCKDDYFIDDGHERVSKALKVDLPFIPIVFVEKNVPDIHGSWISIWESTHHFHFSHYPKKRDGL